MNLIEAISNSVILPKKFVPNKVKQKKLASISLSRSTNNTEAEIDESQTKPVLQLTQFPITIEPDDYKNAKSSSNPNGDLKSLFALHQLVDPVPKLEHYYMASPYSTEMLYENILNGTTIVNNEPFTSNVVNNAKKNFENNIFQDMDGIPGNWRPIYTIPEDWATADISRFKEVSIDFKNISRNSSFYIIHGQENLQWRLGSTKSTALNPASKINSVKMKYLFVAFRRPWLDLLVFKIGNWFIPGQSSGFCSSGSAKLNDGILPLLPTGMLIAKDVSLDANWHEDDQAIIDKLKATGETGSLGPLLISGNKTNNSSIQIIGWVSDVVPFSPSYNIPIIIEDD